MPTFIPVSGGTGLINSQTPDAASSGQRIGDTAEYLQYINSKVIDPVWGTTTQRADSEGGGSGEYHYPAPPTTSMDVAFQKWQNHDTSIDPYWAWKFDQMNRYHEGRFAPGYAGEEGKYKPVSLQLAKDTLAQWEHDQESNGFDSFLEKAVPITLAVVSGNALAPVIGAGGAGAVIGGTNAAMNGGNFSDVVKGAFKGWVGGTIASNLANSSGLKDAVGATGAKAVGGATSAFVTSGGNPVAAIKGAAGSTLSSELGDGVTGSTAKVLTNMAIDRAAGGSDQSSPAPAKTPTVTATNTTPKKSIGYFDPTLFSSWLG